MNRQQLLQLCMQELSNRRASAQSEAYKNLMKARKHPEFLAVEKEERQAIFELGKSRAFGDVAIEAQMKLNDIREKKEEILNNIGIHPKKLSPSYHCPHCQDIGYINSVQCTCLKKIMNNILMKESGAGKEILTDFADFDAEIATDESHKSTLLKLRKKFETFIETFPYGTPKFVMLTGKPGVGKTFITECLAKGLIDRGFLVSFVSAFGMNNMFLSYHTCFDDQKQNYMNALIDPDVLVIDDLGTEPNLKNVTLPYLHVLLSERSRLNKLTIITTNLAPQQILEKYNERIFSRICNKKESFLTQIVGTDLRLTSKK